MQTLLFDLGGVVVDYRGPERLAALSKGAMTPDDARRALSAFDALHAFERGEIAPEDFAEAAVKEWRLDASPAAFIADFETWPERLYEGVKEMIAPLRSCFRLACLSNINIPHWRRAEALGLGGFFDHDFLSHEMGSRKPETAIYRDVADALKVPAGEIIFFDDVKANIDAASDLGMHTHHIEHPHLLGSLLKRVTQSSVS
jgi:glucose-1-phosphatase